MEILGPPRCGSVSSTCLMGIRLKIKDQHCPTYQGRGQVTVPIIPTVTIVPSLIFCIQNIGAPPV